MVHFSLGKRGPLKSVAVTIQKQKQKGLKNWHTELYGIWLEKVRANPQLYDDAKKHHGVNCICCSRILQSGNDKAKPNRKRERRHY